MGAWGFLEVPFSKTKRIEDQQMTNIAILGFGVVGSGTAEVLSRCQTRNNHRANQEINLKYIVDLRDFPDSPYHDKFIKDFSIIENDPDLHIVVETIGGIGAAYAMTKKALEAGKSVVTSNKELVAIHGTELLAIAKKKNCNYLFEAAVGGGIPILRPLTTCLMGNHIHEISGILNGTTNFILSKMIGHEPLSYQDAVKEAQRLGYAEQDPSADVEGKDACRKISILGNIIFGGTIDPDTVPTTGITQIHENDVTYAGYYFANIKLIGRAFQDEKGQRFAYVSPHIVTMKNHFHNVNDAFNMISVNADSLGNCHFYGQGAGDLPTASAVMGDVLDLAADLHRFRNNGWDNTPIKLGDINTVPMDYYVRIAKPYDQVESLFKDVNVGLIPHDLLSHEEWMNTTTGGTFYDISKNDLLALLKDQPVESIIPVLGDV